MECARSERFFLQPKSHENLSYCQKWADFYPKNGLILMFRYLALDVFRCSHFWGYFDVSVSKNMSIKTRKTSKNYEMNSFAFDDHGFWCLGVPAIFDVLLLFMIFAHVLRVLMFILLKHNYQKTWTSKTKPQKT